MQVGDTQSPKPDSGFVRAYDARAARRQFQVSIVLVLALALAAAALGLSARLNRPVKPEKPAAFAASSAGVAGTLLDIRR
ncbi:MAG: hypothetical protein L0Y57_13280 [Beijerinckiaceae bacterium]|nr:hypothetical protein [Beijerinckiaceae bacterium]